MAITELYMISNSLRCFLKKEFELQFSTVEKVSLKLVKKFIFFRFLLEFLLMTVMSGRINTFRQLKYFII
jgi:hypothetical protein